MASTMTITSHRWSHRCSHMPQNSFGQSSSSPDRRLTGPGQDQFSLVMSAARSRCRPGVVVAHWRGVRSNPPPPSDPIPPCDVTVDGQRTTLRPHAATDTIADLARALDTDPGAGLWIDGSLVEAHRVLTDSGLHVGSEITTAGAPVLCGTALRIERRGGGDRRTVLQSDGVRSLLGDTASDGHRRPISDSTIQRSSSTTGSSTSARMARSPSRS